MVIVELRDAGPRRLAPGNSARSSVALVTAVRTRFTGCSLHGQALGIEWRRPNQTTPEWRASSHRAPPRSIRCGESMVRGRTESSSATALAVVPPLGAQALRSVTRHRRGASRNMMVASRSSGGDVGVVSTMM